MCREKKDGKVKEGKARERENFMEKVKLISGKYEVREREMTYWKKQTIPKAEQMEEWQRQDK